MNDHLKFSAVKTILLPLGAVLLLIALSVVAVRMQGEPQFESDAWTVEKMPPHQGQLGSITYGVDQNVIDDGSGFGRRVREVANDNTDHQFLPDCLVTPGAIYPEATLKKIQQDGYSKTVRNVPVSEKKQVLERYGLKWEDRDKYEIDHLVPLCIGGSNDISNLWPQPYAGQWGARIKDHAEREALKRVREGTLPLKQTQENFASDWVEEYKLLFGPEPKAEVILESEQ